MPSLPMELAFAKALGVGLLTAAALGAAPARADSSPALDRVSLLLGGYYAQADLALEATSRTADLATGPVHLATGEDSVGRARLDLLLWDHQGLTFDYYSLDHSSSRTLDRTFYYEDIPFEINTVLTGKFDFTAGSAAYHWWFGENPDTVGIGLGATYYRAKFDVSGTLLIDGYSASGSAAWTESAVAPLITVAYKHAFSQNLRVYVDVSGVKKNGGRLSGHIRDARVGVEWFPWHNVGFGAEYGGTHVHLKRSAPSYVAALDIDLHGPSLFARLRF